MIYLIEKMEGKMKKINRESLTGERALFKLEDARIIDCIFHDGESPLKECHNIELENCVFKWKYPLWYSSDIEVNDCKWLDMARAGVWYSKRIIINDSLLVAPKNFRRCSDLVINNTTFTDAAETLWECEKVKLNNVTAKGDYFAMNSNNMEIDGLILDGNYSFDGGKNITIKNSKLLSKDAFWNSENITVYDSYIAGEYLGWNAKNLTLINCTVESLQGLCYIENLIMKNCKMINTTLAFEYSTVDVEIVGEIDSILNPTAGRICTDSIGEITVDDKKLQSGEVKIISSSSLIL